jgi:hypothetical protein
VKILRRSLIFALTVMALMGGSAFSQDQFPPPSNTEKLNVGHGAWLLERPPMMADGITINEMALLRDWDLIESFPNQASCVSKWRAMQADPSDTFPNLPPGTQQELADDMSCIPADEPEDLLNQQMYYFR